MPASIPVRSLTRLLPLQAIDEEGVTSIAGGEKDEAGEGCAIGLPFSSTATFSPDPFESTLDPTSPANLMRSLSVELHEIRLGVHGSSLRRYAVDVFETMHRANRIS